MDPRGSEGPWGCAIANSPQKKDGMGAVTVKYEHAQALAGLASGKSGSSFPLSSPATMFDLAITSLPHSGLHTVMDLVH